MMYQTQKEEIGIEVRMSEETMAAKTKMAEPALEEDEPTVDELPVDAEKKGMTVKKNGIKKWTVGSAVFVALTVIVAVAVTQSAVSKRGKENVVAPFNVGNVDGDDGVPRLELGIRPTL